MSVTTAIDKMAEDIGYDIGMSSDKAQADLLNGLGKAFKTPNLDMTQQMAYLVNELDANGKFIIRELGKFLGEEL